MFARRGKRRRAHAESRDVDSTARLNQDLSASMPFRDPWSTLHKVPSLSPQTAGEVQYVPVQKEECQHGMTWEILG